MDIIDPHQFIDVGLFLKSAVQISDACFEYRYKRKQDGKTIYFDLNNTIEKSEKHPNRNHMQHKLLKTNTYYSCIYNLPFLLVFTTFVKTLCLFGCLSLLGIFRNILLN